MCSETQPIEPIEDKPQPDDHAPPIGKGTPTGPAQPVNG